MLQSALPRVYLGPPAMSYLPGYYEEAAIQQRQAAYAGYVQQHLNEAYAAHALAREAVERQAQLGAGTPCPLDLSLKPAPGSPVAPRQPDDCCEPIEVDDEEDRRSREEARSQHSGSEARYPGLGAEDGLVLDDADSQRSCSSAHSYHSQSQSQPQLPPGYEISTGRLGQLPGPELVAGLCLAEAEKLRASHEVGLPGYPDIHPGSRLELLTHPSHHPLQTYQHLLHTPPPSQAQQQQQPQPHHHQVQGIHAPMTPPSTPSPPQCPKRRHREEDASSPGFSSTCLDTPPSSSSRGTGKQQQQHSPQKLVRVKKKHARKLKFDEETSSPVSGTVILGPNEAPAIITVGDFDPAGNLVEVTEEARAELAKIENKLGPYQCKLCRHLHDDAFQLAQHRCSRIRNVEYHCPECEKRFSCPANLASHRRWHKPRPQVNRQPEPGPPAGGIDSSSSSSSSSSSLAVTVLTCARCDVKFGRQSALRKHMASRHPDLEPNNNNLRPDEDCKPSAAPAGLLETTA